MHPELQKVFSRVLYQLKSVGSSRSSLVLVGLDDSEPDYDEDDSENQEHDGNHDQDDLPGLLHPHLGQSHLEGDAWHVRCGGHVLHVCTDLF